MFITRSCSHQCPLILLQGARLEQVHHFKYLGVWLSDDLTCEKHIEYITNRARCHLGYIFRMHSPYLSPDSLIRLYHSQVLPIIEYGCIVWDPHLFSESADTLSSHFCIPSSLCLRRNYLKLLFMYKVVNSCVFVLMVFSISSKP